MAITAPCATCGEQLAAKAKTCPHCGVSVESYGGRRPLNAIVAIGCFGTVVLAPIGLWLLVKNEKRKKTYLRGVTR